MDKFQIAKYALWQITALVYGILVSGTTAKFMQWRVDAGYHVSEAYYFAVFMRDYGAVFLVLIILWTALAAYYSSSLNEYEETPWPAHLAIGFCALLVLGSTFLSFLGFMLSDSN